MPDMEYLGTEYTTFPIHYGGDGGYEVRVVAVTNDTHVTIPAYSLSSDLDMGQFLSVNNTITAFGFHISCSKPCMAVQYMRNLPASGEGIEMSTFLAVLTPDDRASNDMIFTLPSMIDYESGVMHGAISIIINTYPVTGLYLNDTSLNDLNWQSVSDSSMWYATTEVESGFYSLYSSEPSER